MTAHNVLRVNSVEEQAGYREAVAEILRRIQTDHRQTLLEIAEAIDVSLGTISNAANKKTDLCATYLNRLGCRFGPGTLDPYAALSGARMVPLESDDQTDALPSTSAAIHKLAIARSSASPGGERITHGELLDMEPEIDAAIRSLTSLKVRCSLIRSNAA
jgi:transcriptional regulator with XRE-family HTH domain